MSSNTTPLLTPSAPSLDTIAFPPGVYSMKVGRSSPFNGVQQLSEHLVSNGNQVSVCPLGAPPIGGKALDNFLSRAISDADSIFDWLNQLPASEKRHAMRGVSYLGCLLAEGPAPGEALFEHSNLMVSAISLESDLDGRFERFLDSLHGFALPDSGGFHFVDYTNVLTQTQKFSCATLLSAAVRLCSTLNAAINRESRCIIFESENLGDTLNRCIARFLSALKNFVVSAKLTIIRVNRRRESAYQSLALG